MFGRIRRWVFGASAHTPSFTSALVEPKTPSGTHATSPSVEDWVTGTWARHQQSAPGKDGRLRLRGANSLDICASPELLPDAVNAFAGWIRFLRAAEVAIELRSPEGWRVCAVRDGVTLMIRVRERLQPVAALGGVSRAIERLFGGGNDSVLVPSQRLELQIMRFGITAASIAFDPATPDASYHEALGAMRQLWAREARYQDRLRALAATRGLLASPGPRSTRHNPLPDYLPSLAMRFHEAPLAGSHSLAQQPTASRQHMATVEAALSTLELAVGASGKASALDARMAASLASLASRCGEQSTFQLPGTQSAARSHQRSDAQSAARSHQRDDAQAAARSRPERNVVLTTSRRFREPIVA
jgi:hypothetical protein